jgi:hypothetical protein
MARSHDGRGSPRPVDTFRSRSGSAASPNQDAIPSGAMHRPAAFNGGSSCGPRGGRQMVPEPSRIGERRRVRCCPGAATWRSPAAAFYLLSCREVPASTSHRVCCRQWQAAWRRSGFLSMQPAPLGAQYKAQGGPIVVERWRLAAAEDRWPCLAEPSPPWIKLPF